MKKLVSVLSVLSLSLLNTSSISTNTGHKQTITDAQTGREKLPLAGHHVIMTGLGRERTVVENPAHTLRQLRRLRVCTLEMYDVYVVCVVTRMCLIWSVYKEVTVYQVSMLNC